MRTRRKKSFFVNEDLYVVHWSLKNYIILLHKYYTKKLPAPHIDANYTCYYVSCGTWGAYHTTKKCVYFCPFDMEHYSLSAKELLLHEITHTQHEHYVKNFSHTEKEDYINEKMAKNTLSTKK